MATGGCILYPVCITTGSVSDIGWSQDWDQDPAHVEAPPSSGAYNTPTTTAHQYCLILILNTYKVNYQTVKPRKTFTNYFPAQNNVGLSLTVHYFWAFSVYLSAPPEAFKLNFGNFFFVLSWAWDYIVDLSLTCSILPFWAWQYFVDLSLIFWY